MLKALGILVVLIPVTIVALLLLSVVSSLALGILGVLLFKVLPVLLVGYLVLHFFFPEKAREVREEVRGMKRKVA